MFTFVHPLLLWGLAIAAAPVLIHLINMMRHRRVEWAAMEFLLVSQKKHRTWVILKQLLLMLLRMLALAAIVLMVAQPLVNNRWSRLFGRMKTHHVIVWDDSYSMSDRWADTSAFSEAKRVIQQIGSEAAKQSQPQSITLLRYSHVGKSEQRTRTDYLNEPIDDAFPDHLKKTLDRCEISQTGAGPVEPFKAIGELLGDIEGERRILYVLSDFRSRDWDAPADAKKWMQQWQSAGSEIHLIDCIDRARPNLSLVSLQPEEGIRTANVQWFMEVAVTNYGPTPVKDVPVHISEDGKTRPSLSIAQIPPGRTVKERFRVNFPQGGWHTITARLESDPVDTDNTRHFTIDLPSQLPVLLIDGDSKAKDARYLDLLMNPGGSAKTGLRPQIELPRFLSLKPLDGFSAVNLANIDRLDKSAVTALEKYVAEGGGAVFFLGERCQSNFFNQELYREGKGLFPLPLKAPIDFPADLLEVAPDLQIENHFIFRAFREKRNALLQSVLIHRYFAAADRWKSPSDNSVRVLAQLRNGAPLVVEKSFGKGRVIAFLTSAVPTWNNLANTSNPGVLVLFLDLQAYLCGRETPDDSRQVGEPLQLVLDPGKYSQQVRFTAPHDAKIPSATIDAPVQSDDKMRHAVFSDTDLGGIYKAQYFRTDNTEEVRQFAVNVDPSEGNLASLDQTLLAERLSGLKYQFDRASAFQTGLDEPAGINLRETLLYLLLAILIAEQFLAYATSYHPASSKNPLASGGVR